MTQMPDDSARAIAAIRAGWRRRDLARAAEARALAEQGRGSDTEIAHVTPGEMVLHPSMLSPDTLAQVVDDLAKRGIGLGRVTIGSADASVNPRTVVPEFRIDETVRRHGQDPPRDVPNHLFSYSRAGIHVPDFERPANFPATESGRNGPGGASFHEQIPRSPPTNIDNHVFKYSSSGAFVPELTRPPNAPSTAFADTNVQMSGSNPADATPREVNGPPGKPISAAEKLRRITGDPQSATDDDLVWARLKLYFYDPLTLGLAGGPEAAGFGFVPAVKYGPLIEAEIGRRNKSGVWRPSPMNH